MPTHDGSGIYQGLLKGTLYPPRWESVIFLLALCSSSHLPMKHKTIEILIVLLTGDFYGEGGKKAQYCPLWGCSLVGGSGH